MEGGPAKVTKDREEWERATRATLSCQPFPAPSIRSRSRYPGLAGGEYVTRVAAGQTAVYAVTNTGRLFAWGSNQSGELGRPQEDLKTCGSECKEDNERIESKPLPVSLSSVEAAGISHPMVTNVYAGGKYAAGETEQRRCDRLGRKQ